MMHTSTLKVKAKCEAVKGSVLQLIYSEDDGTQCHLDVAISCASVQIHSAAKVGALLGSLQHSERNCCQSLFSLRYPPASWGSSALSCSVFVWWRLLPTSCLWFRIPNPITISWSREKQTAGGGSPLPWKPRPEPSTLQLPGTYQMCYF